MMRRLQTHLDHRPYWWDREAGFRTDLPSQAPVLTKLPLSVVLAQHTSHLASSSRVDLKCQREARQQQQIHCHLPFRRGRAAWFPCSQVSQEVLTQSHSHHLACSLGHQRFQQETRPLQTRCSHQLSHWHKRGLPREFCPAPWRKQQRCALQEHWCCPLQACSPAPHQRFRQLGSLLRTHCSRRAIQRDTAVWHRVCQLSRWLMCHKSHRTT